MRKSQFSGIVIFTELYVDLGNVMIWTDQYTVPGHW